MDEEKKELMVRKANKFVQEYKMPLSLSEIRIVNYLIANIDSPKYDKEFREFRFGIKEFADIIYPDKNNGSAYSWLPDVIKGLADKSAWKELPSTEHPGKTKKVLIRWIEKPVFESGYIKLKLDADLAPFLLQLDKGYFQSKFIYSVQAQSKYTIPLYELLKSWEKVKTHKKTFEIIELRTYMNALEKSKDNMAEFKRRALQPAVDEINSITDLFVTYTEIKKGKKTTHVEFEILKKEEQSDKCTDSETNQNAEPDAAYHSDIETILHMMSLHDITLLDAQNIYDSSQRNLKLITEVYEHFKNKPCDNFVGLMIAMVKPDAFKRPKKSASATEFTNFKQRNYDFKELEKQLLDHQ